MRLVSFDAFRSLGIAGVQYIKPDHFLKHADLIQQADWILFPQYWQVNALYYGLNVKIFPSISSYHIGHNKIEQARAFQLLAPASTPSTMILANTPENSERIWVSMSLPFVAKIPKSSEGRGVFLVEDRLHWRQYLAQTDVLFVQEYLPIDRDMRVVVIGRKIVGGYWRLQSADGFHNNLAQGGSMSFEPLPSAALDLVRRMATSLNINHGGFDVAMVGDHPYLLEFNRLFGNRGLVEQQINPAEIIQQYLVDESGPDFGIERTASE